MVRINLVHPKQLADQHLVAEYNEILMLAAYIRKYPDLKNIPKKYCLGCGHMMFFKNKVVYLRQRHELLKVEMKQRGFRTAKSINLNVFRKENKGKWKPVAQDVVVITKRILSKLRLKPTYYRYCGKYRHVDFFIDLLKN